MLPEVQKSLGAFYTPKHVAEFLTNWAVRNSEDVVLDPSAGAGVFLLAARNRIMALGGDVGRQVRGIELSMDTYSQTTTALKQFPNRPMLVRADFFDQSPGEFGAVNAIVGNPPFIRYQRFHGVSRRKALLRAAQAGVVLSELCSSWAPFLVHATQFLAKGGRMAVVAPTELSYAVYAKPVVQFLERSFATVRLLVFRRKLFPELSEDTVLVLADGRGLPHQQLTLHPLEDAADLRYFDVDEEEGALFPLKWTDGVARLVEYLIPPRARELYRALVTSDSVTRLGNVANVGIGYVTGNNEFFHLSSDAARDAGIEGRHLLRAVRNARAISGLAITSADWNKLSSDGNSNNLLAIRPTDRGLSAGLKRYLLEGKRLGVHKTYKCRMRDPWFSVPHVYVGDAFLSYMSGQQPRLFVNTAKAVAPNTLHVVRLKQPAKVRAATLATGWYSSLTALSCEIEGHAMGGGMLKLEPREAANVAIPLLSVDRKSFGDLDIIARTKGIDAVRQEVDRMMQQALGLRTSDIRVLKEAAGTLRERRMGR